MSSVEVVERRVAPRYDSEGLLVQVRRKGRLIRLQGVARDFNRHGAGVILDQPLKCDTTVYLNLSCGDLRLDGVVAVVHNCCAVEDGFRCGVRFRPDSGMQVGAEELEDQLRRFEARFSELQVAV